MPFPSHPATLNPPKMRLGGSSPRKGRHASSKYSFSNGHEAIDIRVGKDPCVHGFGWVHCGLAGKLVLNYTTCRSTGATHPLRTTPKWTGQGPFSGRVQLNQPITTNETMSTGGT